MQGRGFFPGGRKGLPAKAIQMKRNRIDYDCAAPAYADHRRVHPGVLGALQAVVRDGAKAALEIGCGTGNFIGALASSLTGMAAGVEPAGAMLAAAHASAPAVRFTQGTASHIPFRDSCFDLVFSVDVVHHIGAPAAYFHEMRRVVKPGGRVCTATDSEWIIQNRQPLATYFPETIAADRARYHSMENLRRWMAEAGFSGISDETFEHTHPLQNADAYESRAFSVLHLISDDAFAQGLRRLKEDLEKGQVLCTSRYVLLWGVN
jgi:ubiquinone/menaquinone biosynthesis C-methylase UbiE